MKRRIVRIVLGLLGASLLGCAGTHPLRPNSGDAPNPSDDELKGQGVTSQAPKGFFKNSRLSGALSDEGREIERDFGIH